MNQNTFMVCNIRDVALTCWFKVHVCSEIDLDLPNFVVKFLDHSLSAIIILNKFLSKMTKSVVDNFIYSYKTETSDYH